VLDGAVVLRVQIFRHGKLYERFDAFSEVAVKGLTISQVGTYLQRQVYESLMIVFEDALNEVNEIAERSEQ